MTSARRESPTRIADEEGHIDVLETQIALFVTLGEDRYGLLNAKPADAAG